jgi:acetyltransferase-like isoleucine patch superfamily enzyme
MTAPVFKHVGIVDVSFGANVVVHEPVNLYGCILGDDCFIGSYVEIQKGVVIGRGCRIEAHSFMCELVTLGDGVLVGQGTMFTNDKFADGKPAARDPRFWYPTHVGNHVRIGPNATILPVAICANAIIEAGAVVTRDIRRPGIYAGNPARLVNGPTKSRKDRLTADKSSRP